MKKIALIFGFLPCVALAETDAEIALTSALSNVRAQCSSIANDLAPLKKMAGISTAVNAAGTAVGAGGLAVGLAKWETDKKVSKSNFDIQVAKLEKSEPNVNAYNKLRALTVQGNWDEIKKQLTKDLQEYQKATAPQRQNIQDERESFIQTETNNMNKNQRTSDVLGGVRTGLFATNTATNVAGAILSSKTSITDQLGEKIKACASAIENLKDSQTRVRMEDGESANQELLNKTSKIISACGDYKNADVAAVNKLAKGGIITGSVGAATGAVATVTSVMDTSNKESKVVFTETSNDKDYMAVSHALGGATAVASLVGTILNVKQLKHVKHMITVSENCEEALR